MTRIHPTAVIDSRAVLDSTVEVGAYSIIGPNVTIDAGTKVGPHVVIEGHTSIGRDNTFFQFGSIGAAPRIRNMLANRPAWRLATVIQSESLSHLILAHRKTLA